MFWCQSDPSLKGTWPLSRHAGSWMSTKLSAHDWLRMKNYKFPEIWLSFEGLGRHCNRILYRVKPVFMDLNVTGPLTPLITPSYLINLQRLHGLITILWLNLNPIYQWERIPRQVLMPAVEVPQGSILSSMCSLTLAIYSHGHNNPNWY